MTADRDQERALIVRAKAGERDALRELIDLHRDRLFAFIWRMVRNYHDAEEICQDAFLKAFASLDSFSPEFRFSTWLFTIGYRICLNQMRRKRPLTGEIEFASLPDRDNEAFAGPLQSEDAERLRDVVWSAIQQLSSPQQATLLLFYRHEFGCGEIARVLGLPVATVKSHLHRARNRLRTLLDPVTEKELHAFRNRSGTAG